MTTQEFILYRIAQLRMKKNISEKQMSRELGKSPSYLSSIENNRSLPSTKVLIEICDYFEISMKDFFDVEKENPMLINQISNLLVKCSEENLQMIYQLLKQITINSNQNEG